MSSDNTDTEFCKGPIKGEIQRGFQGEGELPTNHHCHSGESRRFSGRNVHPEGRNGGPVSPTRGGNVRRTKGARAGVKTALTPIPTRKIIITHYNAIIMGDSRIKTDWLANNAVVSFFGSLLLGQYTETAAGGFSLPFGIELQGFPPVVNLVAASVLFLLAIFLALSSAIPPLRRLALAWSLYFVPALELSVWLAFTLGFIPVISGLPATNPFSFFLIIGGLVLWVFLLVRFLHTCATWSSNEKPD